MIDYLNNREQDESAKYFREQVQSLEQVSSDINKTNIPHFHEHFMDLCKGVLGYVGGLEQDIEDMKVILDTTLEHSSDIESDLTLQQERIASMWEKYEYIVNATKDWMCLIDEDFSFEAVNEPFCNFCNKKRDELIGSRFEAFWGKKVFNNKIKPLIMNCLSGEETRDEVVLSLNSTEEITLDVRFYPFKARKGDGLSAIFVAQDITAKKQEGRLKEQTRFFDQIHDAIFILDDKNKIAFWNKSAEYLYGWTEEEVLGKKVETLVFKKDKRYKFKEVIEKVRAKGEWEGQMTHLNKDKEPVSVSSRWSFLRDQGDSSTILVSNEDLTERKKLEMQFFRAQRTESIGALASGIAHDLNNVLTLFFMSIRALKPKLPDKQSQTILSLLESSAKRGADLVQQIVNFAKGIEGECVDVDIEIILVELESVLKRTLSKKLNIVCNTEKKISKVYGNPTQIYQVLLNLCLNARDAMPEGGDLKIEMKSVDLSDVQVRKMRGLNSGKHVFINISDNGMGMSQSIINKIFEPFFTTKEAGKGTGLGLTAVMTIVKRHNGYLDVVSKVGKGTKFKIYFPGISQ